MPEAPFFQRMQRNLGRGVFGLMATLAVLHLFFAIGIRMARSPSLAALYDQGLALSLSALGEGYFWTLATYGLLHDLGDPFHVLFNLLGLYFFGPVVEREMGTARFFRFFWLAVVAGGLLQVLAYLVLPGGMGVTVGASAGVMALLAAFTFAQPDARMLLFFVVPVQARYLVPIVLGVDLLMWVTGSNVAFFAHVGGVLAAWVMLRGWPPRLALARMKGTRNFVAQKAGVRRKGPFTVLPGGKPDDRDRSNWN